MLAQSSALATFDLSIYAPITVTPSPPGNSGPPVIETIPHLLAHTSRRCRQFISFHWQGFQSLQSHHKFRRRDSGSTDSGPVSPAGRGRRAGHGSSLQVETSLSFKFFEFNLKLPAEWSLWHSGCQVTQLRRRAALQVQVC
jgi:hypothetical protein